MNIENEAKYRAKSFLLENRISKITLENIVFILEKQGFQFVEYSQHYVNDPSWMIIKQLKLEQYALSGKAFAYKNGATKLIFLCDEMTADEKIYALAHEEGHILCGHLETACDGNSVEQEHLANEIAHYLITPPLYIRLWVKMLERKRFIFTIIAAIGCVAIVSCIAILLIQNSSYHGNYYVTENGSKYHEEDCMIIKDKTNTRRLTEKDYESGEYEPCQVCLPD